MGCVYFDAIRVRSECCVMNGTKTVPATLSPALPPYPPLAAMSCESGNIGPKTIHS